MLLLHQAEDIEGSVRDARKAVQTDQEAHVAVQNAIAADKDEIAKQGAALVDIGKQVMLAVRERCCVSVCACISVYLSVCICVTLN